MGQHGYTVLSGLSLDQDSTSSLGIATNGQPLSVGGGVLSLGTFSLSITTAASATAIPSGNLGIVFRSSGVSLVYVSGATVYSIAGSATSGAA